MDHIRVCTGYQQPSGRGAQGAQERKKDREIPCLEFEDKDNFEKLAASYSMELPANWKDQLQKYSAENGIESASHGHRVRFVWRRGEEYPNGKALCKGNIHLNQLSALSYLCSDGDNNVYRFPIEQCRDIHADRDVIAKKRFTTPLSVILAIKWYEGHKLFIENAYL